MAYLFNYQTNKKDSKISSLKYTPLLKLSEYNICQIIIQDFKGQGNILSFLTLIPLYRCVSEKEKKKTRKICKYSKECLKAFVYLFKCEIEKNVKVLVS